MNSAMNRAGHTRIVPAALRKAVEAVASEAFNVPLTDVSATLRDDTGRLGVDLLVRLPVRPLPAGAPERPGHTLFERADIARLRVSFTGRRLTGMDFGRINIRLGAA